ncbi:sigma-54 dependent transcriptional regulator [Myxococcota bacterium]|nr:sigma-54 dependent transcriptional regulator [Myxococcota bacterium]
MSLPHEREADQFGRLLGCSAEMLAVFEQLREVAASDASVIIEGETGTGKELVGEAIHEHSARADQPYVVVDCAAVPSELIESELFGHVRGAFTGAVDPRKGAFEAADGGTIFIDEIGELPLSLQPRLLRVLERREVKRVGSNVAKAIDVRVLAATNRDLAREVDEGRFRGDLYFRLAVVKVKIPALRERREDILFLAEHFLRDYLTPRGDPLELRADARERLFSYDWPGNVRELRNTIDRGAALSDRYFRVPDDFGRSVELDGFDGLAPGSGVGLIDALELRDDDGPDPRSPRPAPITLPARTEEVGAVTRPLWHGKTYKEAKTAIMEDFELGYLTALLEQHHGNVSAAARAAGIHRNILHRMIARYGLGR